MIILHVPIPTWCSARLLTLSTPDRHKAFIEWSEHQHGVLIPLQAKRTHTTIHIFDIFSRRNNLPRAIITLKTAVLPVASLSIKLHSSCNNSVDNKLNKHVQNKRGCGLPENGARKSQTWSHLLKCTILYYLVCAHKCGAVFLRNGM